MKSYLYFLKYDGKYLDWSNPNHASAESDNRPLVVNCASCVNTPEPHRSINKDGRLDYLLMYVIEGTLEISTPLGNRVARSGDLFVIPPKTSYFINCTGSVMYFLTVHFTGSEVLSKLKEYEIKLFPAVNSLNQKNHMQIRFKKLFEGFSRNDRFRDYDLSCLLERLLIEAGRSIHNKEKGQVLLNKSISYINEYFYKKIRITELAEMENMCMTTYNKYFKQIMGISPTKYIIKLRIRSAKEQLEFTDLPIKEIAIACGYDDLNFFSKTFKSEEGVSPSEYRQSSRKYKLVDYFKNPVDQPSNEFE